MQCTREVSFRGAGCGAITVMAFCSVQFLNMGVMKLHNCTRWRLRYWRSVVDDRTYFVEPGDVGEYTWGTTYTLNAEVADDGSMSQGSRNAVNKSGDYYAYYTNGKITIYDYEQFQSCMPNDDNPYVSIWSECDGHIDDLGGLGSGEGHPHQPDQRGLGLPVDGGTWLRGLSCTPWRCSSPTNPLLMPARRSR